VAANGGECHRVQGDKRGPKCRERGSVIEFENGKIGANRAGCSIRCSCWDFVPGTRAKPAGRISPLNCDRSRTVRAGAFPATDERAFDRHSEETFRYNAISPPCSVYGHCGIGHRERCPCPASIRARQLAFERCGSTHSRSDRWDLVRSWTHACRVRSIELRRCRPDARN